MSTVVNERLMPSVEEQPQPIFSTRIEELIAEEVADKHGVPEYEIALRGLVSRAQDLGFRIEKDDGLGHRYNATGSSGKSRF